MGEEIGSGEIRDLGSSFEINGMPAKPQDEHFIPALQKPEPKAGREVVANMSPTPTDLIAEKVARMLQAKLDKYIDKFIEEFGKKLDKVMGEDG